MSDNRKERVLSELADEIQTEINEFHCRNGYRPTRFFMPQNVYDSLSRATGGDLLEIMGLRIEITENEGGVRA